MQDEEKKREQRRRRADRARWLSVLSWGTVVTSIAGFFAIWHGVSTSSSTPSDTASSAPQQSSGGDTAGLSVGQHHRHLYGGSGSDGFGDFSGYGSSGASGSSDGSQGSWSFNGGGNLGAGSAGIAQSQTPDFRSGAS